MNPWYRFVLQTSRCTQSVNFLVLCSPKFQQRIYTIITLAFILRQINSVPTYIPSFCNHLASYARVHKRLLQQAFQDKKFGYIYNLYYAYFAFSPPLSEHYSYFNEVYIIELSNREFKLQHRLRCPQLFHLTPVTILRHWYCTPTVDKCLKVTVTGSSNGNRSSTGGTRQLHVILY